MLFIVFLAIHQYFIDTGSVHVDNLEFQLVPGDFLAGMGDVQLLQKRTHIGIAFVAKRLLPDGKPVILPRLFDQDDRPPTLGTGQPQHLPADAEKAEYHGVVGGIGRQYVYCLLYTSDAADE